jgi:hypothetical protein
MRNLLHDLHYARRISTADVNGRAMRVDPMVALRYE